MRVLHVRRSLGVGGSETYIASLCPGLMELGHEVALCCPPGSWLSWAVGGVGVPILHNALRNRVMGGGWLSRLRLLYQARAFAPDLIHSHHPVDTRFADWVARRLRKPLVRTVHDLHPGPTVGCAQALIAVSRAVAEATRKEHPDAPWPVVVHNGVDTQRFRPASPEDRRKWRCRHGVPLSVPLLGAVSRLAPVKRHDLLLTVLQQVPDAWLVVAGDGRPRYRRQLQGLARSLGVAERVRFLGTVHDTPSAFAAVDLLAHTAEEEAFCLSAIEAMACAVPVVAFAVGGLPEVVESGVTGELLAPCDVGAFTAAVTKLLADPFRLRTLGEAARRRVVTHFGQERLVAGVERVYLGVAGSKGVTHPEPV
ncbi:MAG TPA: glycosyltransferase family 4 protein [Armatimonadota bacterium]|jgi:glycosyltransferase involved in cell wall biosynthesis